MCDGVVAEEELVADVIDEELPGLDFVLRANLFLPLAIDPDLIGMSSHRELRIHESPAGPLPVRLAPFVGRTRVEVRGPVGRDPQVSSSVPLFDLLRPVEPDGLVPCRRDDQSGPVLDLQDFPVDPAVDDDLVPAFDFLIAASIVLSGSLSEPALASAPV